MKRIIFGVVILAVAIVATATAIISNHSKISSSQSRANSKAGYVALGDSVAAGIGLEHYSDASACDRTDESYPVQLARKNNFYLTSFACSAATIPEGIVGSQTVSNLPLSSQLESLFSSKKSPELITITIGANDINWTQFLACYTTDCPASLAAGLSPSLSTLRTNLSRVFATLQQHYGSDMPKVIVTGYYQLIAEQDNNCSDTVGLDATEKTLITNLLNGLNEVIKSTASTYDFVTYVPIDFTGHEYCSKQPWIQGLSDKAPFHPNASGQTAIANQISRVIQSHK